MDEEITIGLAKIDRIAEFKRAWLALTFSEAMEVAAGVHHTENSDHSYARDLTTYCKGEN